MLLNTTNHPVRLPRSFSLVHCAVLEDQPVLCGCSVPGAQGSKSGATHLTEKQLGDLVTSLGIRDLHLSANETEEVIALVREYADVFASSDVDLGRTGVVQHTINTGDAAPIKQRPHRIPYCERPKLEGEVHRLLDAEVIQPSSSPWASPIVLVRKKDGGVRMCVDFRKVNLVTKKDCFPLPRLDETLDALAGAKFFSSLDLLMGYHQVEMAPDDREKTAFVTHLGQFQYRVMPFGLTNAPATFQRLMSIVLHGHLGHICLAYLDDILIFARDFGEHVQRLRLVFQRLRDAGLKLKPSKCKLFRAETIYLGHRITADGVGPDPEKMQALQDWPRPTSAKELASFLGFVNFYHSHIGHMSSEAGVLYEVAKAERFQWDEQCEEAFQALKWRLINSPLRAHPDFNKPFVLSTDASGYGVGGVLIQEQNGIERPVGYFSRVLIGSEKNYCTYKKELLAIVRACEHFRVYLMGRPFVLRTDHQALKWFFSQQPPEGNILCRWMAKLQEYPITLEYVKGRNNVGAEAMSRIPWPQANEQTVLASNVARRAEDTAPPMDISWEREQELDPDIVRVKEWLVAGTKPKWQLIAGESQDLKTYSGLLGELFLDNGLVKLAGHRKAEPRLVVPRGKVETIIQEIHQGYGAGHQSVSKILPKLKERYYWPAMKRDTNHFVLRCDVWGRHERRTPNTKQNWVCSVWGHPWSSSASISLEAAHSQKHGLASNISCPSLTISLSGPLQFPSKTRPPRWLHKPSSIIGSRPSASL